MKPTPIIDMFSGTGELARAVADGLNEFTGFQSFSDNYGPARKYLKARFRNVEIPSDFRDHAVGLSRTASIRLAGNAVVRLQARLMLQRGLLAVGNINLKGIL